jgi:hypothetical protein
VPYPEVVEEFLQERFANNLHLNPFSTAFDTRRCLHRYGLIVGLKLSAARENPYAKRTTSANLNAMNRSLILLAAMALISASRALAADTLDEHTVSISGDIIQEVASDGTTKTKPITIANVLAALGTNGDPRMLRYYFDFTTDSVVIAPRSDAATASGTPLATVFSFGNTALTWNPTAHSSIDAEAATALNGSLSGTALENVVFPHTNRTSTTKFTLFGTTLGLPTIMKGTIVFVSQPFG